MELRRAETGDAMDLLSWRNDALTRAMSFGCDPVPRADHEAWMASALDDPDRLILIAEANGAKIGTVRFDRDSDGWTVSITVAPEARGAGHGTAMLTGALARLRAEKGGGNVTAEVKPENAASLRLFERCGFARAGESAGRVRMVRPAAA